MPGPESAGGPGLRPGPRPRVAQLVVYPVKSCRGCPVPRARVAATGGLRRRPPPVPDGRPDPDRLRGAGLEYDRTWMVVDAGTGRFLSQRQNPAMALVEVALGPLDDDAEGGGGQQGMLSLSAPGMGPLEVPLERPGGPGQPQPSGVSVWEWSGSGVDEGNAAAAWWSVYLQRECRLVRHRPEFGVRQTDPAFAPGHETAFSDGFPFLLAGAASLERLNAELAAAAAAPVPMDRFRPNIVVAADGCRPFEEDGWGALRVAPRGGDPGAPAVEFSSVKPCARCQVPNVDQGTGIPSAESQPFAALSAFRKGADLGYELPGVFFGWNLVCRAGVGGVVSVGDELDVELAGSGRTF